MEAPMNPSYFIPILFICSPLSARPAWVEQLPNAYSAVGVAKERIAAGCEAAAALAQSFGMDVSSKNEINIDSEGFSFFSDVRTKTEHTLYGAHIAETWFDKKRGEYYALVSLDKEKALPELLPRAKAFAEILSDNPKESLPRDIARLSRQIDAAKELRSLNAQLRVLGERPIGGTAPEELEEEMAELWNKFSVRTESLGTGLASATGLKISPKSPFTLKALRYSFSTRDTGIGVWICSLSLIISLEEGGTSLAALAYLQKSAGEDKKSAEEGALAAMEQQLTENFKKDLYAALSGKE